MWFFWQAAIMITHELSMILPDLHFPVVVNYEFLLSVPLSPWCFNRLLVRWHLNDFSVYNHPRVAVTTSEGWDVLLKNCHFTATGMKTSVNSKFWDEPEIPQKWLPVEIRWGWGGQVVAAKDWNLNPEIIPLQMLGYVCSLKRTRI